MSGVLSLLLFLAVNADARHLTDQRNAPDCLTRYDDDLPIEVRTVVRDCIADLSNPSRGPAFSAFHILGPRARAALPILRRMLKKKDRAPEVSVWKEATIREAIKDVSGSPPLEEVTSSSVVPVPINIPGFTFSLTTPDDKSPLGQPIRVSAAFSSEKNGTGQDRWTHGRLELIAFSRSRDGTLTPLRRFPHSGVTVCRQVDFPPYQIAGGCGLELLFTARQPHLSAVASEERLLTEDYIVGKPGTYLVFGKTYISSSTPSGDLNPLPEVITTPIRIDVRKADQSANGKVLAAAGSMWLEASAERRLEIVHRLSRLQDFGSVPVLLDMLDAGAVDDFELYAALDSFCDKKRLVKSIGSALNARRFQLRRTEAFARAFASARTVTCGAGYNLVIQGLWDHEVDRLVRTLPLLTSAYGSRDIKALKTLAWTREELARKLFHEIAADARPSAAPQRRAAEIGLARLGEDRYLDAFIAGLSSIDPLQRADSVKALTEIRDIRAVKHLFPLLDDKAGVGLPVKTPYGLHQETVASLTSIALFQILPTVNAQLFHPGVAYHNPDGIWKDWWAKNRSSYENL